MFAEIFFDLLGCLMHDTAHEAFIKGANRPVERAATDLNRTFDAFIDIKQGNFVGVFIEHETTSRAACASHKTLFHQSLHNFGQMVAR